MFQANSSRKLVPFALFSIVAAILALVILTGSAAALTRVPTDGEVPFYARFGVGETFEDDGWTTIIFYRLPECVPEDFNMLDFFHFPGENDPGAFGCQPTTTEGYEFWEGEPGSGPAPKRASLKGKGAVPVWFVNTDELNAIIEDDGVVTIVDLQALNPVKGSASSFYEVLHPGQSNEKGLVIFRAVGDLDDGGTFWARASYIDGVGSTGINIDQ